MLIGPWGEVISQLAEGEGVVCGEIDTGFLAEVRQSLPALKHRKM
jgi:nitrilase